MHRQQPQQPSLSRRWACDRCRNHKLRCLRTQGVSDGSCVRCARAGASCVTGAPMPLGRSRANADDTSCPRTSRKPRHSVFVAVTVPASAPQASSSSAVQVPSCLESDTVTDSIGTQAQSSTLSALDCLYDPFTTSSEELPSLFLDGEVPGGQNADAAVDDAPVVELPNTAEPMNPFYSQSQEDFTGALEFWADPALQPQSLTRNALDVASSGLELSMSSSHVVARLAHLNEGIAHQLACMETLLSSIPPTGLNPSCVDMIGDRQVNPMLPALESTAALTAIIQQIISPVQDEGPLAVTTPLVLMCLSGHMQLLQIYNVIFRYVHRFLTGLRDNSSFFANSPSVANISGLPPIKADLYIKVVIQVAEHDIGSLERAIGLPPDMCLSPQRASPKSLLGYVDSPERFWSIMDQACSPAENSARVHVESLRTEIGNVLGLLTM